MTALAKPSFLHAQQRHARCTEQLEDSFWCSSPLGPVSVGAIVMIDRPAYPSPVLGLGSHGYSRPQMEFPDRHGMEGDPGKEVQRRV